MMNAGKKKDPKPTRANADSSTHRAPDRDLSVVMREKFVESQKLDERREFYRNLCGRVIAGKYYLGCGKRKCPGLFLPCEEEQDRGQLYLNSFYCGAKPS